MEQRAKALTDTQSHPPTCTPTLPEVPERTRLWGGQNLGFHLPAHTYKGRPSVRGEARLHTRRAAQKRVHGFIRKNTFLIAPRTRRAHVPAPAHSRTYTHPSVRPHVHHTQTHTEHIISKSYNKYLFVAFCALNAYWSGGASLHIETHEVALYLYTLGYNFTYKTGIHCVNSHGLFNFSA